MTECGSGTPLKQVSFRSRMLTLSEVRKVLVSVESWSDFWRVPLAHPMPESTCFSGVPERDFGAPTIDSRSDCSKSTCFSGVAERFFVARPACPREPIAYSMTESTCFSGVPERCFGTFPVDSRSDCSESTCFSGVAERFLWPVQRDPVSLSHIL